MKLDYTLESPEERKALVEQILAETPNPTPQYLEALADYLIIGIEKKEKKVLTENRLVTINKRECSFEGLTSTLENGEDGIYNLLATDRQVLFAPKISITEHDLETIPLLRQLRDAIESLEAQRHKATGRNAYLIKKALIEMRKDQYLIKQGYQKPIIPVKVTHNTKTPVSLPSSSYLDEDNKLHYSGFSLADPAIVSAILCNYSRLKEDSYDDFTSDTWYLMQDFDRYAEAALKPYPLYERIVTLKIDGLSNAAIQETLAAEGISRHSAEYISSLWRNKIPKLISSFVADRLIEYHFHELGLPFKKCTKCGKLKPAHNNFYSINSTSKDHWYSICKECRNRRYALGKNN